MNRRTALVAGALGVAVLGGGAAFLVPGLAGDGQTPQAVAARFDASLAPANRFLASAADTRVAELVRDPYARNAWGTAQLVAVAGKGVSAPVRANYEREIAKLIANPCGCVTIEGTPLTIISIWIVLSFTEVGKPPPPAALDALLNAQSPRGWWSSALDAAPDDASASLYSTVWASIALSEAAEVTPAGPLKERIGQARRQAATWMTTVKPDAGGAWSDYPNSEQRSDHPVFSAMATAVLIGDATPAEAKGLAATFINGLESVDGPGENFSNDINVQRRQGSPYVDTYRHIPLGWESYALALALPHLTGAERDKADALLASAAEAKLDSKLLMKQDWMLAETIFGIRRAAKALAKK